MLFILLTSVPKRILQYEKNIPKRAEWHFFATYLWPELVNNSSKGGSYTRRVDIFAKRFLIIPAHDKKKYETYSFYTIHLTNQRYMYW
jgi:hypothetical protein